MGERRGGAGPVQPIVELVGPHLRVRGRISLGRFTHLADLVNHHRSFLVLHDARLLDQHGQPTDVGFPELVVNQDDVTFIGHEHEGDARPAIGDGLDRPVRTYAIFTPGHAITGTIHLVRDTTLVNFVETTDPRFIALSDVVVTSLEAPVVVSRFDDLLVNRTQISAITETDHGSESIAAVMSGRVAPSGAVR